MDTAGLRLESLKRRQLISAVGMALAASTALPASIGETPALSAPVPKARSMVFSPGLLGPQLIAAGVIEPSRLDAVSARAGEPLNELQRRILLEGADTTVAADASSAFFLLNLFWAVGLANRNRILTRGPMTRSGFSRIGSYASTGGWTLGTRPVMDLYASLPLIRTTQVQQERLEQVASGVFRPCCDNPTSLPDCNHGMAMLGLLTLLVAEGRTVDELFGAAKTASRFWFPDAVANVAAYSKVTRGIDYEDLDGSEVVGRTLFSGSGYRQVSAWAGRHGVKPVTSGSSC